MRFKCFMAATLLCGAAYGAELTEEQEKRLFDALVVMGTAPMTEESRELCEYVMREGLDVEHRASFLERFLTAHPFNANHAFNLEAHTRYSTVDRERMARFAGAFAAAGLRANWLQFESTGAMPQFPLLFLESVFNTAAPEMREAFAQGIQDVLGQRKLFFSPLFALNTPYPGEMIHEAMQACITLGVFAKENKIGAWLDIPKNMEELFVRTGVWLFDGGVLGSEYYLVLESVFTAIPSSLHGINVLHLTEATGFTAVETSLRSPGLAIDIPLVDMMVLRETLLFPGALGVVPVPEFTATVLERVVGAVQATQFRLRSDLGQRAAAFMNRMAGAPDSAFAAFFPPEILQTAPPMTFNYLCLLWLVNSQRLLEAAITLAEQQGRTPLYAVLLVADLFSNREDTTVLLRTSPTGVLFGSRTALRRASLTPDISYVNGIALSGRIWQYEMGDLAGLF